LGIDARIAARLAMSGGCRRSKAGDKEEDQQQRSRHDSTPTNLRN
jgi:hypothetical protein